MDFVHDGGNTGNDVVANMMINHEMFRLVRLFSSFFRPRFLDGAVGQTQQRKPGGFFVRRPVNIAE